MFLLWDKELIKQDQGTGTTMIHVSKASMEDRDIRLPPLPEQLRITAKLESLFQRSKTASADLSLIPRLVERYKQAILAAAFRGDLTKDWREARGKPVKNALEEITRARSAYFMQEGRTEKLPVAPSWKPSIDLPNSWSWASVDQLTTRVQYGSSSKTFDPATAGVPVLRMGNIVDGNLDYRKLKYLPKTHGEFPELLLKDGDILFNRTNSAELVGKTAVYSDTGRPTSFASYLICIRVIGYLPELLSTRNSRITTTSCRTTGIPKGWEERGGMTIQTISKQPIGGAMGEKGQPEWMIDGRSVRMRSWAWLRLVETRYEQRMTAHSGASN